MGYLIAIGSLVGFSAYVFLLKRVRPSLATSYAYVNPIVAVALGAGLAGEAITWLELVALLFILTGVVLVALGRGKKAGG
jgi:drug/metabolite transporter (DMT)-like permease